MLSHYKTILARKIRLNFNTYLYRFVLTGPKEIIFKPGQYVMLKVPSSKGSISRLYSIASQNTVTDGFDLIIEIVPGGLASNYLFSLSEKTEVIFQGPVGMFGLKENDRTKIFLITGTGIAPVRSILSSRFEDLKQKHFLFWGLKKYSDIYLFDELKHCNLKICLSREQNLEMIPEADRKYFELGHVNFCFEKQFGNDLDGFDFYLCGGRLVVESLKQYLLSKKVLLENIIFEKF